MFKRYQIVYSSGIRAGGTPPDKTSQVTMWPAAHGEWMRVVDHEAILREVWAQKSPSELERCDRDAEWYSKGLQSGKRNIQQAFKDLLGMGDDDV